jgi:hypothetical protein
MLRAFLAAALVALGAPAATLERNVSRAPGDQAEVSIAADPNDPAVLVAASNDFGGQGIAQRVYASTDGGATWSSERRPPPPGANAFCVDPALAVLPDGRQLHVFACELPRGAGAVFVAGRVRPAVPWEPARAVARPPLGSSDDKPAVAVDPTSGRAYVLWSRFAGGRWAILASRSTDGGRSWSRPRTVAGRGGHLAYASGAVTPDGTLVAVWSELRGPRPGLFSARSRDGGASFTAPRRFASTALPDPRCPSPGIAIPAQPRRCIRPSPIVTAGPDGRVFVTWSDRAANGAQDVLVAELGRGFRRRVNAPDGAAPADQFWPVSAVDPQDGTLWACWYDTRRDRSRRTARFLCSASRTRARTWSPAVAASSRRSSMRVPSAGEFEYGDYQGLVAAGGTAHPAWTDARDLRARGAEIWTATLTPPRAGGRPARAASSSRAATRARSRATRRP